MKSSPHRGIIAGLVALALFAGCKDMGTDPQGSTPPPGNPPPGTISFSQRVLPILQRHGCTGCHGGSGGLFVGTPAQLLTGGDHGPAVVAGQAASSNLIRKLQVSPPFGTRMPQGGPYLPDSTVNVISAWINQGAANN
ncbi:MAG: hypothetical protein H6Q32_1023 [Bacteroidetes bacterium]|nr:hypothetical protein [Bacteroidota bacterium]